MLDTETKERFIIMRAENKSYSQIQKELHIGKSTCIELQKEFNSQIAELKAENLERLYNTYSMTKEARIKALGKTLKKINTALENTDFSKITPEKLLDFKLKYSNSLKQEYAENAVTVEGLNKETLTDALKQVLQNIQNGSDPKKIALELSVLEMMLENGIEPSEDNAITLTITDEPLEENEQRIFVRRGAEND